MSSFLVWFESGGRPAKETVAFVRAFFHIPVAHISYAEMRGGRLAITHVTQAGRALILFVVASRLAIAGWLCYSRPPLSLGSATPLTNTRMAICPTGS